MRGVNTIKGNDNILIYELHLSHDVFTQCIRV